jgi:hypothetical protein
MSRTGKIARLPRPIREELNRRLDNGEPARPLLAWVNRLPDTRAVLQAHFGGAAITPQNLSEWRQGGFAAWQARQDMRADTQELAADAAELETATSSRLVDDLATVLQARYASALVHWDGEPTEEFRQKMKILRGLCRDIAGMRRADNNTAWVRMEEEQIEAKREKTQEEVVAEFEKWSKVPAVRDWLCQTWETPRQREEKKRQLLGLPPLPPEPPVAVPRAKEEEAEESLADLGPEDAGLAEGAGAGETAAAGTSGNRVGMGSESGQIKLNPVKIGSSPEPGRAAPAIAQSRAGDRPDLAKDD